MGMEEVVGPLIENEGVGGGRGEKAGSEGMGEGGGRRRAKEAQ